jgi:glycosyltransferase involved in cell wall biosynthesis
MKRKLPVIIAGTSCLSGVTSWSDQLCTALADHPRYDVQSLHVGPEAPEKNCDLTARTLDEAHRAVCDLAPAIVIPNYVWSLFLTGFEPGIRCVGMCHADSEDQYYRPLGWYEPAIAKYVAVSKECSERLTKCVPYRAPDISMLPYGVCIPPELNRTYQNKPLRLIYAGRVTQPQKRVWDFVPLIEHLLRTKVPFVFDIVGAGDEFAPLQQVMQARIPAANVHFHPRVPHQEMAAKWLSHDVFLQVSEFEGTSVSMLEAMAHGVVPVVTAASSGIAGVIRPSENGFVVPVGDMATMASVLAQLAGKTSSLSDIGRRAYRTAQAYAMDSYAQKFARVLDQVAEVEQAVDYRKRYGIYSPMHPLHVQRQLMQQPNRDSNKREKERALKRLFTGGLTRWRSSKPEPALLKDQRAA